MKAEHKAIEKDVNLIEFENAIEKLMRAGMSPDELECIITPNMANIVQTLVKKKLGLGTVLDAVDHYEVRTLDLDEVESVVDDFIVNKIER